MVPSEDRRIFLIVFGRGRLQRTGKGVDGMLHFVRERLMRRNLVAVLAWNRATAFATGRRILNVPERVERSHEGIDDVHTDGTTLHPTQATFNAERSSASRSAVTPAMTASPPPTSMWNLATARAMTDLTGGGYYAHQYAGAAAAMDHLDQATRFEYVLGYCSSNPAMDRKSRRITVTVNRPDAARQYRHGCVARPAVSSFDLQRMRTYSRIAAAANAPGTVPDIGLKATTSLSGRGRGPFEVLTGITIDPSR
ncbi:MAG: hypothetical protein ABI818_20850, partial [Acidobacteriota bacterium]